MRDARRMRPDWALAAILVLGSVVIVPRLGRQSLWLDESLTIIPALHARSLGDLVGRVLALDSQPPGSHLLLYELRPFLPATEFGCRLPSFVAMELGIVVLFCLARALWGRTAARATALAAQLSPYGMYYAMEARNYGLWFLLASGAAAGMYGWHRSQCAPAGSRSARGGYLAGWLLCNAYGLWTHLFHVFVLLGQAAVAAAGVRAAPPRVRARYLATAGAVIVGAMVPFLPWMRVLAAAPGIGVPFTRPFTWETVGQAAWAFHFDGAFGPSLRELHLEALGTLVRRYPAAFAAGAVVVACTAALFGRCIGEGLVDPARRTDLVVFAVYPAAVLLGPVVCAAARGFPLHPRHLMPVWPLLPLALGVSWTGAPWRRALVLVVLAGQVVALGNLLFDAHYAKADNRGAILFADEQADLPASVLAEGAVAEFYCRRAEGRGRFAAIPAGTREVWVVESREWEAANQRVFAQLGEQLAARGFVHVADYDRFRGVRLRRWRATRGE